jgi:hypothetical protein
MERRKYLKLVSGIGGLVTFSGATVAQEDNSTTAEENEETYISVIGPNLKLLDYEISNVKELEDSDRKVATFTVKTLSEKERLNITLTDAFSAFASKGVNEVQTSEKTLARGTNEFNVRTTAMNGMSGLGISTPNSAGIGISTGLPSEQAAGEQQVGLGESVAIGGGVGLSGTAIAAHRKMKGTDSKPLNLDERLDEEGGIW